jgi:DNA replication protein DnaC
MTADTVSAELRQVLRDLKLSGVLDTLPERVALARQSHLPHQEFLTVVPADEVARRERRSATTRARAARLDATMTLEGWDESTDAVYDRDLWAELCTLRFVEARRDLVIMGAVGVGKTFMASDLGTSPAGAATPPSPPAPTSSSNGSAPRASTATTTPSCAGSSASRS